MNQEQQILGVHLRGVVGMCTGCRAWWARLTPYPCWQVEWATSRQARAATARFLGLVSEHPRPCPADLELRRLRRAVAVPNPHQ